MSSQIPNLWPSEVRVDVPTPKAILLVQAWELEKQTQGVLKAEVDEQQGENITLVFDVLAPALGGLREPLFRAFFKAGRVYPVSVLAPCFANEGEGHARKAKARTASSPEQLLEALAEVFKSPEAVSTLLSLIARSNEATGVAPPGAGEPDQGPIA
jgi:hypothetical protein